MNITKAEIIRLLELVLNPADIMEITIPERKRFERLLKAFTAGRGSRVSQRPDKRQIVS